jgi:hypothetical protein
MAAAGLSACTVQPIAHWKFDECEGTRVLDARGTHHGTIVGAPFHIDSPAGLPAIDRDPVDRGRAHPMGNASAMRFPRDRSGLDKQTVLQDVIRVPSHPDLEAQQFCITAWVRSTATPGELANAVLLGKHLLPARDGASYLIGANKSGALLFSVRVEDRNNPVSSRTFAANKVWDGNWHYIVAAYDGQRVNLFVDGAPAGATTLDLPKRILYPAAMQVAGSRLPGGPYFHGDLTIGNFGTDDFGTTYAREQYPWKGDLDDLRIIPLLEGQSVETSIPTQCRPQARPLGSGPDGLVDGGDAVKPRRSCGP